RGYFYDGQPADSFTWVSIAPYDVTGFDASVLPAITGVSWDGQSVLVNVDAGPAGSVALLAQDLAPEGSFASDGPWRLTNVALNNGSFTDTGFLTSGALARIYAVVRDDIDGDGDGLADAIETMVYASDPAAGDSDGDGIPDAWEAANGIGVTIADADGDPDGDGISNLDEYRLGLDPTAPPAPPVLTLAPLENSHTNKDELVMVVNWLGGGLSAADEARVEADPSWSPPQIARVLAVEVQTQIAGEDWVKLGATPIEHGLTQGDTRVFAQLQQLPEGTYTLRFVPRTLTPTSSLLPAPTVDIVIDRTPPPMPDASGLAFVDCEMQEDGSLLTSQREFHFTCVVGPDVTWVVFKDAPRRNCHLPHDCWSIDENGVLHVHVQGLHMGETLLDVALLDKAHNRTTTQMRLRRELAQ
ncbi:MAG: hypothetical protein ACI8W8_003268, partial [Rhodothermales bacterium]